MVNVDVTEDRVLVQGLRLLANVRSTDALTSEALKHAATRIEELAAGAPANVDLPVPSMPMDIKTLCSLAQIGMLEEMVVTMYEEHCGLLARCAAAARGEPQLRLGGEVVALENLIARVNIIIAMKKSLLDTQAEEERGNPKLLAQLVRFSGGKLDAAISRIPFPRPFYVWQTLDTQGVNGGETYVVISDAASEAAAASQVADDSKVLTMVLADSLNKEDAEKWQAARLARRALRMAEVQAVRDAQSKGDSDGSVQS